MSVSKGERDAHQNVLDEVMMTLLVPQEAPSVHTGQKHLRRKSGANGDIPRRWTSCISFCLSESSSVPCSSVCCEPCMARIESAFINAWAVFTLRSLRLEPYIRRWMNID